MSDNSTNSPTIKRDWKPRFLDALRRSANISQAAREAGIDRKTAWNHKQSDPDFATACNEAIEEGLDLVEAEAKRRGADGYDEPIVYQGRIQGIWIDQDGNPADPYAPGSRFVPDTVRRYSDILLMFFLKGRRPEVFRDNQTIQHQGDPNKPLIAEVTHKDLIGNLEPYVRGIAELVAARLGSPASGNLSSNSTQESLGQAETNGTAEPLPPDPLP